jgi:hypothetical protein
MNIRVATLGAFSLSVLAALVGCETRDRSLGNNGNLNCQGVPACQFHCPDGTMNPVDSNNCTHTCECVVPPGGTGMSDSGTVSSGCSSVPQCDFVCPSGTMNPFDTAGCKHTCECVTHSVACPNEPACGSDCPAGMVNPTDRYGCIYSCNCVASPPADAGTGGLQIYFTCGDPACHGYTGGSGAPLCTTEKAGDPCTVEGQECDPMNDCNALLECASSDPKKRVGGPISRAKYKQDIHDLAAPDLAHYRDELLAMKLATWRYKHDPSKQRLGFIIDDAEGSAAVDGQRDLVDLYGYTSMAVATIQLQAQQIADLQRELAALKKDLRRTTGAASHATTGKK